MNNNDFNFDKKIDRRGTNCIKFDAMDKFLGYNAKYPMWIADMDFETPKFIVDAMQKRLQHEVFGYTIRGEEFFKSTANWFERRHGWKIKEEWMLFSPGIVPALNFSVLAYTEKHDKVIVQPPVYFPFFSAVHDHKRMLIHNALELKNNRLNIDFEDFEKCLEQNPKMILLSNPHNPGGSVWTKEELTKLGKLCIEKDVIIISDDIHCDLVYPNYKYTPIASISEEIANQTITFVAPSKTFNVSGLTTSVAIIPNKELRDKFQDVIEKLHIITGNIFGNVALEAAYTHGDTYVDELMKYLQNNVNIVEKFFAEHIPQIKPMIPESTFLIWLDCRDLNMDDKELNEFFYKKANIVMNQGAVFGKGGSGFMRMNIGCSKSELLEVLQELKKAIETL